MNTQVAQEGDTIRWIAADYVTKVMKRNMSLYPYRTDLIRIQNKNFTPIHLLPHEYEIVESEEDGKK